jgi:hypothetical protein
MEKIKIKIKLCGKDIEVSIAEAKDLKKQLDELFQGEKKELIDWPKMVKEWGDQWPKNPMPQYPAPQYPNLPADPWRPYEPVWCGTGTPPPQTPGSICGDLGATTTSATPPSTWTATQ